MILAERSKGSKSYEQCVGIWLVLLCVLKTVILIIITINYWHTVS